MTARVGGGYGLMVQPTSAYYLAAQSGYLDLASDGETFICRGAYFERPQFASDGFVDQEYGYYGMLGTKVTRTLAHGLFGYIGYGVVKGYISEVGDGATSSEKNIRRYTLPGPVIEIEYAVKFKALRVGFEQITLIGFGDQIQTEARVGWPYNLLLATIGFSW
jgi:hypothetical protein